LRRIHNFVLATSFACLSVVTMSGCDVLFAGTPVPKPQESSIHAVRVDTVGYVTDRMKVATVVMPAGMSAIAEPVAEVRSASTDAVVWPCDLVGPKTDPDTAVVYYTADFSVFTEAGEFYVAVPALVENGKAARSAKFTIAADVFRDPLRRAMIGLYGQRCGMAVSITLDGNTWSHKTCHLHDGFQDFLPDTHKTTTTKPSLRGWHDAGDYGKYTTNGAFTVGMMLMAWERFQPTLNALSLPIPEHGGAIPDYLAEIKWQLDWLLTTQFPDGSVSFKVTAQSFESNVLPEDDGARRFYTDVSTAAAGNLVAVLAQAARIYQPYDAALSASYLEAARRSYAYLVATPVRHNPDLTGFGTGAYDAGAPDTDNRLWATAEMWETTGEATFLTELEGKAMSQAVRNNFDYDNVTNLALFTYVLSARAGRNQAVVDSVTTAAIASGDMLVTTAQNAAFGRAIDGYWWGSNGSVVRTSINLWVAALLNQGEAAKYRDAIALQVDHVLGRNFYDRSYVTGMGLYPPAKPHHRPSIADSVGAAWPGLLVGGPQPKATDWVDAVGDGSLNEIAINWNAPLIFAFAALTPAP
jgi:endoglucanase